MKLQIWGKLTEGNQTVRIIASFSELPEDAAMCRLYVRLPELSAQEYYGEAEIYTAGKAEISILCPCDEMPVIWSEFAPKIYTLTYHGDVVRAVNECEDILGEEGVAFSAFRPLGTQFAVAGRPVFIRGVMAGDELEADERRYVKNIKRRGLNCISVTPGRLSAGLLDAADREGIYIKVEGNIDPEEWTAPKHPSLVMTGHPMSGYTAGNTTWMEFAVRDRQDYSDAPDTKSDHREDVYGCDYPTLLTHVGEWRTGAERNTPAAEYLGLVCCREEMEAALRTPQFGGYILQNDAAVLGRAAKVMREFAGAVVPLLMMKKYVWSADELLTATVLIANYSDEKYFERISVTATDETGMRYTKMSNRIRINRGSLVSTGEITIPLDQFTPGQSIELQVSIDDTEYRNHYTIWLFSDSITVKVPPHVHVSRRLDERTKNLLANGKKVIYIPKLNRLPFPPGWFSPLASQAAAHREEVASAGVVCDSHHPVFAHFPTEDTGDFQWWNLVHNSTPIPVPELLKSGCMAHAMDNGIFKAYLGECAVGEGRLIFSAIDLLIQLDRPEARQLYADILSYAASDAFRPRAVLTYDELAEVFS